MKIAEVSISTWGNEYVVNGEFENMHVISMKCKTYGEAIAEMEKIAGRERLRYESGISRNPYR